MISNAPISLLTKGLNLDKDVAKEDEKIFKLPIWLFEIIVSVVAFVFIFLSFIWIKGMPEIKNVQAGAFGKGYGFTLLALIFIYFLYLLVNHKLTYRRVVVLLLMVGFVLRLTYMLYTPATSRQYDTFSSNNDSHYNYAYAFYSTGTLPDHHITLNTIYQFYHPPLNAFIQGMFMRFFEAVNSNALLEGTVMVGKAEVNTLYYSCQILACFYMYLTSLFLAKTINQTKFSNGSKLLAIAFVVLFPRLIQLSGQLNNDGLSILFSVIALYYYVRWYTGKKTWLDMCLTGLFVGLALMSKMSASTIALGMAFGYLVQLIHSIRKEEGSLPLKTLLLQFVAFLVIAAPIGLWWQLYTHFVYDLPFNFVFKSLNAELFTGSRDWVLINRPESIEYYDRINMNKGIIYTDVTYNTFVCYVLPVYFPDFEHGIFCSAFYNYNILSYALRCSIFGEFSNWGTASSQGMAVISTVAIYVLWFSLWVNLIYILVRKKKFGQDGMMMFLLLIGIILMFLYLQVTMPYGCSIDFRYIVPIILPLGYLLAKENDIFKDTIKENHSKVALTLKSVMNFACVILLTSSSLFYMMAN
jgi:hypothetical protein